MLQAVTLTTNEEVSSSAETNNQVAFINSDVTTNASSLASFYAIMVTMANQSSMDNNQAKELLNKISEQQQADSLNKFLSGATSTEDLLRRIDSMKDLGVQGLDSYQGKIKSLDEEIKKQEKIFNKENAKADKYGIANTVFKFSSIFTGMVGVIGGVFTKSKQKKHAKKAQEASDKADKAVQQIKNSRAQKSRKLQEIANKKGKNEAALNALEGSKTGASFFNSITSTGA